MLNYTDLLGQDPAVTPTTPAYFETPLGSVLLLATNDGLMLCDFIDRSDVLLRWMSRNLIVSRHQPFGADHPVLLQAQRHLTAYFQPGAEDVPPPPLDPRGTDFQRAAWELLGQVPLGETADYTVLSRRLGRSGCSAALSRTLISNPLAIFIPCHRVLGPEELLSAGPARAPARRTWLLGHERRLRRRTRPAAATALAAPQRRVGV